VRSAATGHGKRTEREFTDGNDRVGRLHSLLLLYHFDYQVGRYVSLERIIEESRETYYDRIRWSSRSPCKPQAAADAMRMIDVLSVRLRAKRYGETSP